MKNLRDMVYLSVQTDIDGARGYSRLDDRTVVDRRDITPLPEPPIILRQGKHYDYTPGDISFEHPNIPSEANALLISRESGLAAATLCSLTEVPEPEREYRLSG